MPSTSTESKASLPQVIIPGQPITALAPMQDITTRAFMSVLHQYGSPDYYFTEFFRVHVHSKLEPHILKSITENSTGRPVFAQLIGENLDYIKRTLIELASYPIAGIDLNMGCPTPKVYKKNVGGGLLRDMSKADEILAFMRENISGLFTVKMRTGFEDTDNFCELLELINKHDIDLLSLHGRTVGEMYRSDVNYDLIKTAAETVKCPVLANGNISSAQKASEVLKFTKCDGVMIGRSAIRNPWIFRQTREYLSQDTPFIPTLADVREYIEQLYEVTQKPEISPRKHVGMLKKFLNFIAQSVDAEGSFMHDIRRAENPNDMRQICDRHLLGSNAGNAFNNEPYKGLIARPNSE